MRRLIVSEFMSLDGVMEAPGGEPGHPHSGWVGDYMGHEEAQQYKFEEVLEAESLLLGRVTYESFAGAWPTYVGEFADKMNAMHKDVVTSAMTELEWTNSSVLEGDVVEAVTALKAGDGGPILVAGSCTLVHTLIEHELVDELRLMVCPVAVGSGMRVFPETQKKTVLTLSEAKVFDSGVIVQHYSAT